MICKDEFDAMQRELKNFVFVPIMFKDEEWEGEKGIIDKEKILKAMQNSNQNPHQKEYYICGPAIMLNGVLKALGELGINKNKIHFEKFSL